MDLPSQELVGSPPRLHLPRLPSYMIKGPSRPVLLYVLDVGIEAGNDLGYVVVDDLDGGGDSIVV